MSGVRLIQVPYHLGRKGEVLGAGPAPLAHAIGGDSVVVERPGAFRNEVKAIFDVVEALAAAVRETRRRRSLPARPGRELLERARRGHGPRPGRGSRLVRRARGLSHARLHAHRLSGRDGARPAHGRGVERASPRAAHRAARAGRARGRARLRTDARRSASRARRSRGPMRARSTRHSTHLAEHTDAVYVHIDLDVLDPVRGTSQARGPLKAGSLPRSSAWLSTRSLRASRSPQRRCRPMTPPWTRKAASRRIAASLAPRLLPAGVRS